MHNINILLKVLSVCNRAVQMGGSNDKFVEWPGAARGWWHFIAKLISKIYFKSKLQFEAAEFHSNQNKVPPCPSSNLLWRGTKSPAQFRIMMPHVHA
jgi:hypothetical protein